MHEVLHKLDRDRLAVELVLGLEVLQVDGDACEVASQSALLEPPFEGDDAGAAASQRLANLQELEALVAAGAGRLARPLEEELHCGDVVERDLQIVGRRWSDSPLKSLLEVVLEGHLGARAAHQVGKQPPQMVHTKDAAAVRLVGARDMVLEGGDDRGRRHQSARSPRGH